MIPEIEPVPPTNDTPPITQAAIASHSALRPVDAATEPLRTPSRSFELVLVCLRGKFCWEI